MSEDVADIDIKIITHRIKQAFWYRKIDRTKIGRLYVNLYQYAMAYGPFPVSLFSKYRPWWLRFPHRLLCTWKVEHSQDINAYHGIDTEAELTNSIAKQLCEEIDKEILESFNE